MKKVLALILAALLFCCMAAPALAQAPGGRVVRVAYPIQPGLSDKDEFGKYSGYTYEYLEELAQYTGWDYEFVEVEGSADESLTKLMEMVENGQVDLMGGMLYSDALAQQYDYSSYSYGTVETVLQAPYETAQTALINSQANQHMRIAVVKTSGARIGELEEFCKINLVEPEYVLCANANEQVEAVRQGRADALLNTSLNYLEGVRTVARFAQKPFYFITTKGQSTGLMEELSGAMLAMEQANPQFSAALFEKYFASTAGELALSEEEQAYVAQTGTLRVGYLQNKAPFQYQGEDGQARGISIDLLTQIANNTGLQFSFIPAKDMEALSKLVQGGQVDLVAGMTYNYDAARAQGLSMTRSYLSAQYIMLVREGTQEANLAQSPLALLEWSQYEGSADTPIKRYPTQEACIRAVLDGQAGYTYVDTYTAQYYMNQPGYSGLKSIPQTYEARKVCFGMAKPGSKELLSILNKAVADIPELDMQSVIFQNTVQKQPVTLLTLLAQYPLESVCILAGVALVVIGLLLALLRLRARAGRRTALELKRHYQVYALVNEYFFEYDFKKDEAVIFIPSEAGENRRMVRMNASQASQPGMEESQRLFRQTITSGQNGVQEIYLKCQDGRYHWLRLIIETVYDGEQAAYALGRINVIDSEKREKDALEQKAQLDGLTRLYNAEYSRLFVQEALERGEMGALVLVDIDHFKQVNDRWGHPQGDAALQRVAALLKENFREGDILGRPGGDEFLAYLPGTIGPEALGQKCAALCRRVEETVLENGGRITVSVGAALALPQEGYAALYRRADQALYAAKAQGRNGWTVAPGEKEAT